MSLATARAIAQISSTSSSDEDRAALQRHLAVTPCASYDRKFSQAYFVSQGEKKGPKLHRFGSRTLPMCEYAVLADDARRAVLVVDIDCEGHAGWGRVHRC